MEDTSYKSQPLPDWSVLLQSKDMEINRLSLRLLKYRAALETAAKDLDDWGAYTRANAIRRVLDGED